jgi:hypothetical protein
MMEKQPIRYQRIYQRLYHIDLTMPNIVVPTTNSSPNDSTDQQLINKPVSINDVVAVKNSDSKFIIESLLR